MLYEFLAFTALRRAHLDFASRFGRQCFGKQCSLFKIVRNENEARRRFVIVELRKKCAEHFRRADAAVGLREIGAVSPVLSRAEKEYLDAGVPARLMNGKNVRLVRAARIDPLVRLDR